MHTFLTRDQPAVYLAVEEVANTSGVKLEEMIARLVAGTRGRRFACAAAPGMSGSKIVGTSLGCGLHSDVCFLQGASFGEDFSSPSVLLDLARGSPPALRTLIEGGQLMHFNPRNFLQGMLDGDPTKMTVESYDFSSNEEDFSLLQPTMGGVGTQYGGLVLSIGTSYMIVKVANGGGSGPGGSNTCMCAIAMFGRLTPCLP
jgi:hypothetical protein